MILFVENDPLCPPGFFGNCLRQWHVPHLLWRPHAAETAPAIAPLTAVIILGGTMCCGEVGEHPQLLPVKDFLRELLRRDLPCLGICLGGQLLAEALGGRVHSGCKGEKGCHSLRLTSLGQHDPLFAGMPETLTMFQWHNDCFDVPPQAAHLAFSRHCPGQAIRQGRAWGLQFHPEIDLAMASRWWQLSEHDEGILLEFRRQEPVLKGMGAQLLKNFLLFTAG
ncbi:MAG: type 1 glutamine amidotransferase [Desulfuromonadaceae bacterium]